MDLWRRGDHSHNVRFTAWLKESKKSETAPLAGMDRGGAATSFGQREDLGRAALLGRHTVLAVQPFFQR
jgi:hypothetical protein